MVVRQFRHRKNRWRFCKTAGGRLPKREFLGILVQSLFYFIFLQMLHLSCADWLLPRDWSFYCHIFVYVWLLAKHIILLVWFSHVTGILFGCIYTRVINAKMHSYCINTSKQNAKLHVKIEPTIITSYNNLSYENWQKEGSNTNKLEAKESKKKKTFSHKNIFTEALFG